MLLAHEHLAASSKLRRESVQTAKHNLDIHLVSYTTTFPQRERLVRLSSPSSSPPRARCKRARMRNDPGVHGRPCNIAIRHSQRTEVGGSSSVQHAAGGERAIMNPQKLQAQQRPLAQKHVHTNLQANVGRAAACTFTATFPFLRPTTSKTTLICANSHDFI